MSSVKALESHHSGTSLNTHLYLGSDLLLWVPLTLHLQSHTSAAGPGPRELATTHSGREFSLCRLLFCGVTHNTAPPQQLFPSSLNYTQDTIARVGHKILGAYLREGQKYLSQPIHSFIRTCGPLGNKNMKCKFLGCGGRWWADTP